MADSPVRVRFAPSPTGHLHVGGARTALFNWLYARRHGGTFIIRVEDTDQARSTRESEQLVLDDLRWMGLLWDEGPDIGGPHSPYRQSERRPFYDLVARELMASGVAYRCFCTEEELEAKRQEAERRSLPPHYDLTCWRIDAESSAARAEAGELFAIRFHVPREKNGRFDADVTIQDLIRGEVTWRKESLGDFILVRSDGFPTYNFSVVADDHDMQITHVIRAEEHLTNTHRQVLIYRAMGWAEPLFAHVSLILGSDRSKLSKRHGATSVSAYAEEGFLPDAMLNYLALLGWSAPGGEEKFDREFAVRSFSFDRVNSAPAVFDVQKFAWLNGQYIQEMSPEDLAKGVTPLIESKGWVRTTTAASDAWLADATSLFQKGAHRMTDFVGGLATFFDFNVEGIATGEETGPVLREPGAAGVIDALVRDLEEHGGPRDAAGYQALTERLKAATGAKGKGLFMPLRVAITGAIHGPELNRLIALIQLGSENTDLARILSPLERARRVSERLER